MAQLKVNKCKTCFFPLPDGVLECPKCHTVHKLADDAPVNPLLLPPDVTNDYVNYFKHKTEENPKDTNALFGMGLVYMGLKNYELAQRNFKKAVDLMPLEPDVYYYFALSLFEGHNPKHLQPQVSERIEEWLHTASNRQEKRKYLILLMVLRQCAFVANGLQFKGESPIELMEKIRKIMPEQDDVREIRDHVKITDRQTLEWLDELQSGKRKQENDSDRVMRYGSTQYDYNGLYPINRKNDDTQLTYPDDGERIGTWLLDEGTRQEFFDNLYEPDAPVKLEKPSWPIGFLLKRLIFIPLGIIIMLIIVGTAEFGFKDYEPKLVSDVQQEYKELYGKKNISAAQKKKHLNEIRKDSIARAEEDSIFNAEYFVFAWETKDEEGEEKHSFFVKPDVAPGDIETESGFERSWRGLVAILLILLPLIIGLIRLFVQFGKVGAQRKQISDENEARQNAYDHAMYMFNEGRPSIEDYILFCKHYLSKESPILPFTGDPVEKALHDNHIDELDMKGKILFLNYFDDKDDYGNDSQMPHDVLSRIYYVIAIPQIDKLTLLYNYWDTVSNEITSCDAENIYYKNILGVTKKSEGILIEKVGGTTTSIVFPPNNEPSLFAYQSEYPEYFDYSNTRTSDPQVFLDALNALVAAYK